MSIFQINPITDQRWSDFIASHPDASVFHTSAWLKSLRDTYGYKSIVLTTAAPEQPLRNGLVFCEAKSWMTGSRIVSLPFSDHCHPLLEQPEDLNEFLPYLENYAQQNKFKYFEFRPLSKFSPSLPIAENMHESASFCIHFLNLQPTIEDLYQGMHKTCYRQIIQKGVREGLTVEHGRTPEMFDTFYQLLLLTRRRHMLPPQPRSWFQNLVRHFGDDMLFWVARKDKYPVAMILTLASKKSVVYKYGCSNEKFHNLGGMPTLLWSAIQYAKSRNANIFDLGRSDMKNEGLILFKNRIGAQRSELTYLRSGTNENSSKSQDEAANKLSNQVAKQIFARLPDIFLTAAGRLLYRHMA